MRSYRREPAGRPQMCQECENAPKVSRSGDGYDQRENVNVGKSIALGLEADDPAVRLASVVVEIDDESVEQIRMNDDESAEEVAANVCRKNDLPDKFVSLLAEHIIDRYPNRAVDEKKRAVDKNKEDVEATNDDTKERRKIGENQTETKPVKAKKSIA